jgi:acetylornithine deacetylase/succinyl-diaminopimelate desuccinylase-like protein
VSSAEGGTGVVHVPHVAGCPSLVLTSPRQVIAYSDLLELLRIPSVSADPRRRSDVRAALDWVAAFVIASGGDAEIVQGTTGELVVGELAASVRTRRTPTLLIYGHVDVQPPEPLELWDSPPFEPTTRDGWLYCRGVADDKGQLWLLLEAARRLAAEGDLPVNVRILCDGEEEVGGLSAAAWIDADTRGADACVIFDTAMLGRRLPVFNLACRGTAYFHLVVQTGKRDAHSGFFGGAGLNALHVLTSILQSALPRDGRLPDELRTGALPVGSEELASWADLPGGEDLLGAEGIRAADEKAASEFYVRTWAEPSLDVNGVEGGSPQLMKTVIPARAEANLSMRLVPGQSVPSVTDALERLLRNAAPADATLELSLLAGSEPALVSPDSAAVKLGIGAFERAIGVRPRLVRTGGSLPLAPALSRRGIPAVITGFDLPEGNIHAPNERFLLENLELGLSAARELYLVYAGLR